MSVFMGLCKQHFRFFDLTLLLLILLAVLNGFGRHIETVSSEELILQRKVCGLAELAVKVP